LCHAQQHIKSRTQAQITRCEYTHSVTVRCKRVGLINASVPFVAYSTHQVNKYKTKENTQTAWMATQTVVLKQKTNTPPTYRVSLAQTELKKTY
jgi:hypothetical protein